MWSGSRVPGLESRCWQWPMKLRVRGADPEDGTDSQWRNAVSNTRAWIGLNTRPGLRSVVISWSSSHDWGCDGIGMGPGKIRGKRLSLVNASEQQA
jgi:hypothetical protein